VNKLCCTKHCNAYENNKEPLSPGETRNSHAEIRAKKRCKKSENCKPGDNEKPRERGG